MATNWTPQQRQAINQKGRDILVSAAAGSGKTAVLVERIIQRITAEETPLDIDQLLVVTFTKAAAAEMKERIATAVTKKLEQCPQNVHLQNQLAYLSHADIKTIHAFCLQVIREFGYLLDIDPAAQTADPSEIRLLQKEVLTELFEELYETENEEFLLLLETYSESTGDNRLKQLILRIYEFAQGNPNPTQLLQNFANDFSHELSDCRWIHLIQTQLQNACAYSIATLQKALRYLNGNPEFTKYQERIETDLQCIQKFADALQTTDYAQWHKGYVTAITFDRMPAYRGEQKEFSKYIQSLRNDAKDTLMDLKKQYFCYGVEFQNKILQSVAPVAKALSALTIAFSERFSQAKKEHLWLDFHDYEHFALQILTQSEYYLPTPQAKELQQKYAEVMIDEYQDSNLVQELLLRAVSKADSNQNNRFMVGDVKQSIYRFRLAMPELFNEKYDTYTIQPTPTDKEQKILLSQNFRSRKNILDGINFLFYQIMYKEFADITYQEESALHAGAMFPPCEHMPYDDTNELILLDFSNDESLEDLEDWSKQEVEANYIAQKIKSLIAEKYPIYDRTIERYRTIEYRDIAVLFRSMKNWGNILDDIFTKEGIPFFAETAQGYFDVPEVDTILNILRLIDNPLQDIPLISLLHSPLYGLSAEELAEIRIAGGEGVYYDCLLQYIQLEDVDADIQELAERFYSDLSIWRAYQKDCSLPELLQYLYTYTGYYDAIGTTDGGTLRQANLRLLLEKAEAYTKTSKKGLFHFIRFVEELKENESETTSATVLNEQQNLVHIMTIHKSKGLEFPVVFVSDLGKQFNETDLKERVLTHPKWGYGIDYTDIDTRVTYQTLCKKAISLAIKQENMAEELRVLYVALTRAKEKLILTGVVKNLKDTLQKYADTADTKKEILPSFRLRRAKTYLDWIVPALLRHPCGSTLPSEWEPQDRGTPYIFEQDCSRWTIQCIKKLDLLQTEEQKQQRTTQRQKLLQTIKNTKTSPEQQKEIFHILSWQYNYIHATSLPAKVSISEIKRRQIQALTEEDIPKKELTLPIVQTETLTAMQIGTAMHTVLEAANFQQSYDADTLCLLIADLVKQNRLTQQEADALRKKELLSFFQSDLYERMQKAIWLHKEQPFSMLLQPKDIFPEESYADIDEWIQVNGIIDCYFAESDGIILVDYKSDRIYQESALIEKYRIQLQFYRQALEQVCTLPIKCCYIYSLAMGKAIELA